MSELEESPFENAGDALSYLEGFRKSKLLKKLSPCIAYLHQFSSTRGLRAEDLVRLFEIIRTKNKIFKVQRTLKLVNCLIPTDIVPQETTIDVLFWFSSMKVPQRIRKELFKWLVAVNCYDVVTSNSLIRRLYDMVFCCLFDDDICSYAAHLLYIITTKQHVNTYKVKQLLKRSKNVNLKPSLLGLLSLYQVYRPEILQVQPKVKRFFQPLTKWRDSFQNVKNTNIELALNPYLRHCSKGVSGGISITLDQDIKTYQDFSNCMDIVESRSNVLEVITSRYCRQFFSCHNGKELNLRVLNWLQVVGYDICLSGKQNKNTEKLIENIAEALNVLSLEPIDALTFLKEYLDVWDGIKYADKIFSLISTLNLYEFSDIREMVLKSIEVLFYTGSPSFQCNYIRCLTKLLKNWILDKLPQLNTGVLNEEAKESIQQLQIYIDKLCEIALMQEKPPHSLILIVTWEFYNIVILLVTHKVWKFLLPPKPIYFYSSLVSFSASTVNEVCDLIVMYREAVKVLKNNGEIDPALIGSLNNLIVDASNILWRELMFETKANSAVFSKDFLPMEVEDSVPNARKCFTFYRHPAFIILTLRFLQEKRYFNLDWEDLHRHPQLEEEYLVYMDRPECQGVLNFLNTFLNREKRQE